jgi:hypothetical protein
LGGMPAVPVRKFGVEDVLRRVDWFFCTTSFCHNVVLFTIDWTASQSVPLGKCSMLWLWAQNKKKLLAWNMKFIYEILSLLHFSVPPSLYNQLPSDAVFTTQEDKHMTTHHQLIVLQF